MTFSDYLLLFAGMGAVTYVPRALPLIYLSNRKMPAWLIMEALTSTMWLPLS